MAVSGLVVHLKNADSALEQIVERVALDPRFEAGDPRENRLPLIVSAQNARSSRELCGWLSDLPEVSHVDVVFVECPASDLPENEPACQNPVMEHES